MVELVARNDVHRLCREGEIGHALVIAGLFYFDLYSAGSSA